MKTFLRHYSSVKTSLSYRVCKVFNLYRPDSNPITLLATKTRIFVSEVRKKLVFVFSTIDIVKTDENNGKRTRARPMTSKSPCVRRYLSADHKRRIFHFNRTILNIKGWLSDTPEKGAKWVRGPIEGKYLRDKWVTRSLPNTYPPVCDYLDPSATKVRERVGVGERWDGGLQK